MISSHFQPCQIRNDLEYFEDKLNRYLPFFKSLSRIRQLALIEVCSYVGFKNFLSFTKLIKAVQRHDYISAKKAMCENKWSYQYGMRFQELGDILVTNQI